MPQTETYDAADLPPADGPLPASVGGFRIDRVLGRGGMGVVYAAHDPQLGRPVAVKVMRADWLAGPVARERFQREARAAAALHHDHIVPVFQVGEDGGEPFLVMPLLPGRTLDARLKAGPVQLAEAIDIARQAAEGLAVAHAAGIVHRDVKPANLFLEDRPGGGVRVRLLDFGIARSAVEESGLTGPGAIMGTPAYVAPEQAYSLPTDHRADLFSLGGVLYHLLTGKQPFFGWTADRDGAKLPPLPATVPPALATLVRAMLDADPAGRPATAGEVVAELSRPPAARPPTRSVRLAAAGTAAAVTLAVVAVLAVRRPDPPLAVTAGVPSAGPAVPRVPPPAPPSVEGFTVLLDARLPKFRSWVATLPPGYRPDALSVTQSGRDVRYTAVAVADGLEGTGRVGQLREADGLEQQTLTEAGYHLVAIASVTEANGAEATNTFWARDKPAPPAYRSVFSLGTDDPAELGEWIGRLDGNGQVLARLTMTGTQLYNIVTQPSGQPFSRRWAVKRTRAQLEADHRAQVHVGYRLATLDATGSAAGPVFHAIWVKDGSPSDFALALTREQLERELVRRQASRSRPYTLSGYDTFGGRRYAVTWVPMGPAP